MPNKMELNDQKIILVDDEQALLKLLAELLSHLGCKVFPAKDYQSACELIDQTPCRWIISDLYLPGENGLAVLEYAYQKQPNAKRIIMSGNIHHTDVEPHNKHLVEGILQKPYSLASLKSLLLQLASS